MKYILILTIMTADLSSVSVHSVNGFETSERCQQAARVWVTSAGKATPALSAICVKTGVGEEESES